MDYQIVSRGEFAICGYAVETTLTNNDADIAGLYSDVLGTEKEKTLLSLSGVQPGYYGLEWYTQGHNSFFYLLGKAIGSNNDVPADAVLKVIPSAEYAVVKIAAGTSLIDAWTEFFYTAIPSRGLAPDESHGFYFEYYPQTTDGDCELWVPVVKIA